MKDFGGIDFFLESANSITFLWFYVIFFFSKRFFWVLCFGLLDSDNHSTKIKCSVWQSYIIFFSENVSICNVVN